MELLLVSAKDHLSSPTVVLSDLAHQPRMNCTSFTVIEAYPALCWLYKFSNRCHAVEVWLGMPAWICYFSKPDLPAHQIPEATLLLGILISFGLIVPISDILRPSTRRGWLRQTLWNLGGSIGAAWVMVCLVSVQTVIWGFLGRATAKLFL